MVDQESCPTCGALPCDWVENPHTRAPTPPPVPAVTREELGAIIAEFNYGKGFHPYLRDLECADAILSRLAAGQQTEQN